MLRFLLKNEVIRVIYEIYKKISLGRRKLIFVAFLIMLLSGFFELLNIGSLLPVLTSFSSPEELTKNNFYSYFLNLFNLRSDNSILYFTSFVFISLVLISSALRIITLYVNAKLAALIGSDISCKVYKNNLFQPYDFQLTRNTSNVITNLINGTQQVVGTLNNFLRVIYGLLNFAFVLAALIIIDFKIAISSLITFSLIYFVIIISVRRVLIKKSDVVYKNNVKIVKLVQESFGSIKDIILDNSQRLFLEQYKQNDFLKRKKEAEIDLLGVLPYTLIEALALISVIVIGLSISDNSSRLEILGTIGLGLQRLLRSVQQIYAGYIFVQGRITSLSKLIIYLNLNVNKDLFFENKDVLDFKDSIVLENIHFTYNKKQIINNFNLRINKGEMIGIKGKTGSGKSTLINIIMGLLVPTKGKLLIDGVDLNIKENELIKSCYFNSISHVSQDIYLLNITIAENIAFGIPINEINFDRLERVAKEASIFNFINSTEKGFFTLVGERGINLSGGQKQRIGIARALYKKSKIFVFDEATSALDTKTENEVMQSIRSKKNSYTIIMIAHRLSTLEKCDSIINI